MAKIIWNFIKLTKKQIIKAKLKQALGYHYRAVFGTIRVVN